MESLRHYAQSAYTCIPLIDSADGVTFLANPGALLVAGDVKTFRVVGGVPTFVNIANLPVTPNPAAHFIIVWLTALEMTSATDLPVVVEIIDQSSPKLWLDTFVLFYHGWIDVNVEGVHFNANAAINLARANGAIEGAAVTAAADSKNFTSALTYAGANHYKNRWIVFTSGNLNLTAGKIKTSGPAGPIVTINWDNPTAISPAPGDTFIII